MAALGQLIEGIAEALWAGVSAPQLPAICVAFGLSGGEEGEAYSSKRAYVRKRITGWSKEQLIALARRVEETYPSEALQLLIEEFEPATSLQVSSITRQHLLRDLAGLGPLEGKLDLLDFLARLWKLDSAAPADRDFRCSTVKDLIFQHMVRNDDYSYSEMLDLLGVPGMSHKRFIEFLEWTVHPLVRVDDEQDRYVEAINSHLRQDGLALTAGETVSGYPVFRVSQLVGGVGGSAKNLIFASTGPKPEIVFTDAVNNDIQIVKNAEFCLVFDQPFPKNGLLWKHLISWWAAKTGCACDDIATERSLYKRMYDSLQSPPERLLFKSYFTCFRSRLGEKLPALIPQVYLHYDPYTARQLNGEKRLPRQRMDFLILISSFERIVIEVDGSQHYSDDAGQAAPHIYAEMVKADRDLRLAGYEVFRFGGLELGDGQAQEVVSDFFSRLFANHNIRPTEAKPTVGEAGP